MSLYLDPNYFLYLRELMVNNLCAHADDPAYLRPFLADPTAYTRQYSELIIGKFRSEIGNENLALSLDVNGDGEISADEAQLINTDDPENLNQTDFAAIGMYVSDKVNHAIRACRNNEEIPKTNVPAIKLRPVKADSLTAKYSIKNVLNKIGGKAIKAEKASVQKNKKAKVLSIFDSKLFRH